ncbi:MAG TPA: alkaline phosphatase family protein [Actinomycetota bacterium]|jgi:predicted AlkP superfamily phosphohydrolase/phosphomutase|nr:alkaline phosphatase family protein [Actinomycetota bacterium]
MPRVLLIGWDGADWRILDPMLEAGLLPNLKALIDRGARGILKSTIPNHSWAAWPSFLTGLEPSNHGVYDIFEKEIGERRSLPVTYRSIKEKTMLGDLAAAGVPMVMTNLPLTFPPPRVEGALVAGGVLPKWRPFTHPESLAQDLERAGSPFPINGMSWTTYRHRPGPFLAEAMNLTAARTKANLWLLDNTDWRFASLIYVATDRVQHCLDKMVAPDHPDHDTLSRQPLAEKVRDVYRLLDEGLGRILERANDEDLVLFISDHGFQSCTRAVHMDRLLEHFGFLKFTASKAVFGPMQWGAMRAVARKVYDVLGLHGRVSLPQSVNWQRTVAYTSIRSTGEGVSINLAGREAEGIVDPADFESTRDRIMEALDGFTDPDTGRKPMQRVLRREDVFTGRFAETAPDIVLEPAPLYSLTHAKSMVEDADWLSGDHRMDGVIAAAGPGIGTGALAEPALLIDMAPTILAALGTPASVKHDGQVLSALVGDEAKVAGPGMREATEGAADETGLAEDEALEVEEHLRGLGYLE